MAEEEKDDWLDDLDGDDDGASEIDQSDIDSLLSGGSTDSGPESEAGDEDNDEGIDQSDIDSLLSGSASEAEIPAAQEAAASDETEEEGELDQSDIDALLSDTDTQLDASGSDPDQDEIDELFSEVDDDVPEEPFQAEEIDFKDVIEESQGEESAFDESSFDAEEFGLDDDIPDIPDLPGDEADEATMFDAADTNFSATDDDATQIIAGSSQAAESGGKKFQMPAIAIPAALKNRTIQAAIGGCLILLLAINFFFLGGDKEPSVEMAESPAIPEETQPAPPQPAPRPQNTAPQGTDTALQLTNACNELAVLLTGHDAENDALDFEILSLPEHGRLSGKAPNLIYIPNKDFPGTDTIVYRITDGKDFSDAVTIKITSPPPTEITAAAEEEKPKPLTEKKLSIAAKGRSYNVDSTASLVIDWSKLWQEANYLPFESKVEVEIISKNIHGSLKKVNSKKHSYRPDKFFGGTESITYRFRLGKLQSEKQTLRIHVALGNPAPEIHLAKIEDVYNPGDTVVLDASATRDENRDSLLFSWEQIAGVPVQLERINQEGSQVAFVVPSSFNTIADPGPVLRLTAHDKKGKKDIKDIKVATQSRRKTAVWRGLVGGGIAEEPACPYGNCPGALLPFPYGD